MSLPAPPPVTFVPAQAAGTGHAAGPSLAGEISRTRPSPASATAIPAGATVPGKLRRRQRNRNRNWKQRRVVGEGDAEKAAASGDPGLTPAPAPGTSLPASSSAATSAVPVSHVPAAPHASAAQRPAAAATIAAWRDATAGREEQSRQAGELKAAPAPHAPTASVSPPSRVPAGPHASGTPFSCIPAAQSSHFPISSIPAAHHASATHLPRFHAAPSATASQAVHYPPCPMPPPRQLPERAAASYPPPRPKLPAAVLISQVPAAPRMPPPRLVPPLTRPGRGRHAPFSFPHIMPARRAPSHVRLSVNELPTHCSPIAPPPRPPTTSRLQGSSLSTPLPTVAAALLLRPPLCETSKRPAPPAPEENECQNVGAVGPAGADRVKSVQPREREESTSAEELKDGKMAIEAHAKSVPPTDATVGRQEESKSAEELKRELERVSKQMNELKNECAELKRGMKNKDLEIEAKEAEIQNFKKAKLKDISSTRMAIDQPFHNPTNEALQAEGSRWTSTRTGEKLNGVIKKLHSTETQQAPGNTQVILNQNNPRQVSVNSTAQTGRAGDWQEEIYQMIKSLKDQHYAELNELFNNISLNVQPVHSVIQHQRLSKKYGGMENLKEMLDRIIHFLQTSKSDIQPSMSLERNKPVQQRVQQQFLQVQMNPYKGSSTSGVQTDTKAALHFRDVATTNAIGAPLPRIPVAAPAMASSTPLSRIPVPADAAYVPGAPHANAAYVPSAPHVNAAYIPGTPHAYGAFGALLSCIPTVATTPASTHAPGAKAHAYTALLPPTSASPPSLSPPVLLSSIMFPLHRMPPLPSLPPVSQIPGDKGAWSEKVWFMLLDEVFCSRSRVRGWFHDDLELLSLTPGDLVHLLCIVVCQSTNM